MANEVDICNLALGHLHDDGQINSISPPDGSFQAAKCAQFYPIARDSTLEEFPWPFAKRRSSMSTVGTPPPEWLYQYKVPNLFIRPLKVYVDGVGDPVDYDLEDNEDHGLVIVTDVENAIVQYLRKETNAVRYSGKFVEACSFRLAAYLAGPLAKGPDAQKAMWQAFNESLPGARLNAARSRKQSPVDQNPKNYVPGGIRARS